MKFKITILSLTLNLICLISVISYAGADNDKKNSNVYYAKYQSSLEIVTNETYLTECGSCHFAYQPELFPARSWNKLMNTLKDHFGDDASISEPEWSKIYQYLMLGSAEKSNSKRAMKFLKSIRNNETPIKITETIYFKTKHDEIRPDVYKRKSIGFAGNCIACHTTADIGNYKERFVRIPGQ
ncbi:MAG: diheme cytochrome c [Nitrospiraceae bacterium]|nr:diheme cytochrome c [Nitrospiraceae bacterium]